MGEIQLAHPQNQMWTGVHPLFKRSHIGQRFDCRARLTRLRQRHVDLTVNLCIVKNQPIQPWQEISPVLGSIAINAPLLALLPARFATWFATIRCA